MSSSSSPSSKWIKSIGSGRARRTDKEAREKISRAKETARTWKAENEWDETYDYVIVGAGSAGCALAGRLAMKLPNLRNVLIEAGQHDDIPEIQTAVDYFGKVESVFGSERDWLYASEPQDELAGRGFYWPRGKVIGGCSSFNTMVYLRGDPEDYENWGRMLNAPKEWGHESFIQHFIDAETHALHDPLSEEQHHGGSGPIMVAPLNHPWHSSDGDASHFITKQFVSACTRLGFSLNLDFAKGTEGVGVNDVNAWAGKRCNAAAYLKMCGCYPRSDCSDEIVSPNNALTVKLSTHVLKIVLDETPKAVGIEVLDSEGKKRRIQASKGVCLCAGAVNTPQILMLSGIGPEGHLDDVGIECIVNLNGVGENLQDHLHVPMCYRVESDVKPHSRSNICEGSLFTKVNPESISPDLQVHIGVLFFDPSVFTPLGEGFTLTPSLIHPKSRGSIRLRSKDVFERPLIQANYLTEEEDLQTLVKGVKLVREIGSEMLGVVNGKEIYPGPNVQSDDDIKNYVINHVGTMYHPACTCRVGRDDDLGAVLDLRLHVRGVENLRVADASAMPEIIGANTNATCIALGERLASFIVQEELNLQ